MPRDIVLPLESPRARNESKSAGDSKRRDASAAPSAVAQARNVAAATPRDIFLPLESKRAGGADRSEGIAKRRDANTPAPVAAVAATAPGVEPPARGGGADGDADIGAEARVPPTQTVTATGPAAATRPAPAPVPTLAPAPLAPVDSVLGSGTAVSAPSLSAAAALSASNENAAIRRALHTYEQAYERLDAYGAAEVWPSLDVQALKRAFNGLKEQELQFDRCQFDVGSAAATAVCAGSSRIVRRVGNATPLVESRQWTFHLKRIGDDWKIESVNTTR